MGYILRVLISFDRYTCWCVAENPAHSASCSYVLGEQHVTVAKPRPQGGCLLSPKEVTTVYKYDRSHAALNWGANNWGRYWSPEPEESQWDKGVREALEEVQEEVEWSIPNLPSAWGSPQDSKRDLSLEIW